MGLYLLVCSGTFHVLVGIPSVVVAVVVAACCAGDGFGCVGVGVAVVAVVVNSGCVCCGR